MRYLYQAMIEALKRIVFFYRKKTILWSRYVHHAPIWMPGKSVTMIAQARELLGKIDDAATREWARKHIGNQMETLDVQKERERDLFFLLDSLTAERDDETAREIAALLPQAVIERHWGFFTHMEKQIAIGTLTDIMSTPRRNFPPLFLALFLLRDNWPRTDHDVN